MEASPPRVQQVSPGHARQLRGHGRRTFRELSSMDRFLVVRDEVLWAGYYGCWPEAEKGRPSQTPTLPRDGYVLEIMLA
jgi:hypothetical protein